MRPDSSKVSPQKENVGMGPSDFFPWMIAQRRNPRRNAKNQGSENGKEKNVGSENRSTRFSTLANLQE